MAVLLCLAGAGWAQTFQFRPAPETQLRSYFDRITRVNLDREKALKSMFEEAGCSGEGLSEQPVKHLKVPNVICSWAGSEASAILVTAHTDKAEKGMGAVDNWSGAALLPALLSSVKAVPRVHTFVFIGFSGEEKGLVGSEFYARQVPKESRGDLKAVVNLDSLGLGPTEVDAGEADRLLFGLARGLGVELNSPVTGMSMGNVGSSDSRSFRELKGPHIDFHSVTTETLSLLHTNRDTKDAIRWPEYYESYRFLCAYLGLLDARLPK